MAAGVPHVLYVRGVERAGRLGLVRHGTAAHMRDTDVFATTDKRQVAVVIVQTKGTSPEVFDRRSLSILIHSNSPLCPTARSRPSDRPQLAHPPPPVLSFRLQSLASSLPPSPRRRHAALCVSDTRFRSVPAAQSTALRGGCASASLRGRTRRRSGPAPSQTFDLCLRPLFDLPTALPVVVRSPSVRDAGFAAGGTPLPDTVLRSKTWL